MDYPDSNLNEYGRKQKYQRLDKLKRVATLIKNEREIRAENPSKCIPSLLQSIQYHSSMINSYPETRLRHIQKAIQIANEEYERKLKQSMDALAVCKRKLEEEQRHKSKALLRYEKEFVVLSQEFKEQYGYCPIDIQDNEAKITNHYPPLTIIDVNIPFYTSPEPKQEKIPELKQVVEPSPEPPVPIITPAPVNTPLTQILEKPVVEVVVKKVPVEWMSAEERELEAMRAAARREAVDRAAEDKERKERDLANYLKEKKAREEAELTRLRQQRLAELQEEEAPLPPPKLVIKKPKVRGTNQQAAGINCYSLPVELS